MKNEKLIRSIGDVEDKYILEAAPKHSTSNKRQSIFARNRLLRIIPAAACIMVFILGTTAFAANYIQNSINVFYMRYLSPEEMAVADSMALQYGAKVYFDGLKSDDVNKQYFSINKLVEYYNDEEIRAEAIRAITPFLSPETLVDENADPGSRALADAAVFALSVLNKEFDDPRIIHMADGTILFTLFNDYSDYGTYNQIWRIKDGEMRTLISFSEPKMYIKQILLSPDKNRFAVELISNKSTYIEIWDLENGVISPELIDSARIMVARDLDIDYWQLPDNENFSTTRTIEWIDNDVIEFRALLWNDKTSIGAELFVDDTIVRYDFMAKHMEYVITE